MDLSMSHMPDGQKIISRFRDKIARFWFSLQVLVVLVSSEISWDIMTP